MLEELRAGPFGGQGIETLITDGKLAAVDGVRGQSRLLRRRVLLDCRGRKLVLDAPSQGVDYPFGRIASIVLPGPEERCVRRARVILHGGEEWRLECAGDLGEGNAGMLIFAGGRLSPEYLPWTDVERVDFDRPPAVYPPLRGR